MNRLYYGSRDGIFYCLSMEGKEVWRFVTREVISCVASVHNDKIYFSSGDGNVYCLDLDGNEIWRFRTGSFVYSSPLILENKVYFGCWDCHLYCIDANNGTEIWRFATSTLAQSAINPPYEIFEAELKIKHSEEKAGEKRKPYDVSTFGSELFGEYKSESQYKMKSSYKTKSEYK
jgi:outer membrane protein assembly factor BamB